MAYIIYSLACMAVGIVSTLSGFGPSTWQYWVFLLSVLAAYISGREVERNRK